jgi:hypothetical protein
VGLPHPGLIVLDTPLLTYREPLESKYGELSPDEVELTNTGLATRVYASREPEGYWTFVVVETKDVPEDVGVPLPVETFTATPNSGRYGLFPLRRTSQLGADGLEHDKSACTFFPSVAQLPRLFITITVVAFIALPFDGVLGDAVRILPFRVTISNS